jgi:GAF domain-containing protein
MPLDVAQQHITSIQAAIQSNQSDLIEYSLQPEGENRHYEMRIVPLEDQRALCVVRDVTLQKQLFDSVTARANELNTLHAIALDIARRQDLEELLKITIERAVRLLEGNAGCVYLWDEEHQILDERVKYGGPKEDGEKLLREIEKNALRVVEEGQTILERNISPAIEESNILISAPLLWDQQVIGVINVCGEEESWPDLEQESILLEKLSSMVAIAVQNAQLLSGLEKQLTLSQTLQEMGALLTSRSSLHDVLEEVLNLLERVIKFDSVSIHLLKEGVLQISVSRGFEDQAHLEDLLTERTEDILTERLIKEKYFYIPDTRRSEDWVMFQETLKIRSWMGAILEVRGKVIGVLNVDSYTVNAYNEETAQTVKAFADQAAVAIENARLSSAERREHQRLKTLYTLNQRLSVSLDKDEIIHQTLDLVHAEFEAAVADFFLYDPEKNDLQLAETLGRSPKEEEILLASLDRLSQKSVLSHVLTDLKPTHIEDTSQQEAWLNINQLDDDIRSVITVPVFTQEQLGGALSVMHTEVGRYSSEDVDLMQTIAQQVSLALNNATKYKRVQNLLENLKQEELIQRNLLEHLPLGILLLDANYRIVSSNTNGEDLLQELVPDFEGGEISSLGDISLNQLVMYCDDPNPFEAHSVSHPNKIYEAQIRRVSTSEEKQWLLLIQDVTEMRKSQRQYHLQERLATIGRFAAGIAHDFNNIMSAITVYVDVLNRTLDLPAKSQEHLEIIKNQSMRANELIRQILDFSRQTDLEPLPLDCLALLREVLQILERVFPSDIEIHFEHEEDRSYAVKGDPGRLQQVIMNIAGNARDAMPEGGELFIRLSHLSIQQDEVPPLRLMPSGE